jgi:hypothetical protein
MGVDVLSWSKFAKDLEQLQLLIIGHSKPSVSDRYVKLARGGIIAQMDCDRAFVCKLKSVLEQVK